jgi:hypothetical protein
MKQLLATLFICSGLAATLCAQPAYLNYQGRLSDAAGAPLGNGSHTLEFNIYDGANGGVKVWGPFLLDGNTGNGHAPQAVVLQGRFNVILGAVDTAARPLQDAFGGTNRFVEIKVDGGAPIVPRQQFLSSPYAFRSFRAYDADRAALATMATTVSDATIAYRNSVNTFTGNQTVNGNAIVNGTVSASDNVTVGGRGAAVSDENLRIVRGSAQGRTSVGICTNLAGTGFQVTRSGLGVYVVTITSPFSGIPSVTANTHSYDFHSSISLQNTNAFTVRMVQTTQAARDSDFSFIAIGPR